MADPEFEASLGRWFAESPALPDADGFARRVEGRLDRACGVRRALIGAAGLAGGVVAVGQMLGGHMMHSVARVQGVASASAHSMDAMSNGVSAVSDLRLLTALPVGSEVLWVGAGLAVLAVVFFAARALEEF
jgi:hypothetical protein